MELRQRAGQRFELGRAIAVSGHARERGRSGRDACDRAGDGDLLLASGPGRCSRPGDPCRPWSPERCRCRRRSAPGPPCVRSRRSRSSRSAAERAPMRRALPFQPPSSRCRCTAVSSAADASMQDRAVADQPVSRRRCRLARSARTRGRLSGRRRARPARRQHPADDHEQAGAKRALIEIAEGFRRRVADVRRVALARARAAASRAWRARARAADTSDESRPSIDSPRARPGRVARRPAPRRLWTR